MKASRQRSRFRPVSIPAGCVGWYAFYLETGQTLQVKFRSPATSSLAGAVVYGTNGQRLKSEGSLSDRAGPSSIIYQTSWTAPASGWHFLRIIADPGAVYRLTIR
ncbi:hypothetical protein SBA4_6430002 [Candidatus Sulfopaludibacter sp. SbA4]|nr:hypothetical protein SBA4_6430002 [Candidatus Sulfopaludibacter sp. SbA4]